PTALLYLYSYVSLCRSYFSYHCHLPHRDLHSFPTRRSSDLPPFVPAIACGGNIWNSASRERCSSRRYTTGSAEDRARASSRWITDRKSTRLNSSHGSISYAVFCLKKKKNI